MYGVKNVAVIGQKNLVTWKFTLSSCIKRGSSSQSPRRNSPRISSHGISPAK